MKLVSILAMSDQDGTINYDFSPQEQVMAGPSYDGGVGGNDDDNGVVTTSIGSGGGGKAGAAQRQ